jgi:hypothetical protein
MLFSSILFMRSRISAGRLLKSICPSVKERMPNSVFLGMIFLKDSGFLEYLFVHGVKRTRRFEGTAFLRNAGILILIHSVTSLETRILDVNFVGIKFLKFHKI